MMCFNPKDAIHFTLKGSWFACVGHGPQHFMALMELFSCFQTGARNDGAGMKHWDMSKVISCLPDWLKHISTFADYPFH